MDSMRNLHTSLPRSSSRRRRNQPSAELLQAFKAAALSVTQLYKTAAVDETSQSDEAHAAGYQDALDDLLDFLDQKNLGLGDGEGWQVRQWATQRSSNIPGGAGHDLNGGGLGGESDEEKRARSASPVVSHKPAPATQQPAQDLSQQANDRDAASSPTSSEHPTPRPELFHFRSGASMPPPSADAEMANAPPAERPPPRHASPAALRLEVVPSPRQGRHHASARQAGLGHGAGSKRKIVLPDFFDLGGMGGLHDKRDGFDGGGGGGGGGGGSKRGRFA